MKQHRAFLLCLVMSLGNAVPFAVAAASGEVEWKKVSEIIEKIKNPTPQPTSRDQAFGMLKVGLVEFDAAYGAALKAGPDNPDRWDAALFDGLVMNVRKDIGVVSPNKFIPLSEIVSAADAKPETKATASAYDVLMGAEESGQSEEKAKEWLVKAEAHLLTYPKERMNEGIIKHKNSLKVASEIKTKPLELKFTAVDGTEVDISKLKGKVVLIDFWATWCGPCVAELPEVLAIYKELHDKGLEIVGISLDQEKEKLESFTKEKGMTWPQYFDGKGWENSISSRFGITEIPTMWLVDKKGMVVNTTAGLGLKENVEKLLAEKE